MQMCLVKCIKDIVCVVVIMVTKEYGYLPKKYVKKTVAIDLPGQCEHEHYWEHSVCVGDMYM